MYLTNKHYPMTVKAVTAAREHCLTGRFQACQLPDEYCSFNKGNKLLPELRGRTEPMGFSFLLPGTRRSAVICSSDFCGTPAPPGRHPSIAAQ